MHGWVTHKVLSRVISVEWFIQCWVFKRFILNDWISATVLMLVPMYLLDCSCLLLLLLLCETLVSVFMVYRHIPAICWRITGISTGLLLLHSLTTPVMCLIAAADGLTTTANWLITLTYWRISETLRSITRSSWFLSMHDAAAVRNPRTGMCVNSLQTWDWWRLFSDVHRNVCEQSSDLGLVMAVLCMYELIGCVFQTSFHG